MSTSYYHLKHPITSLRVEMRGEHAHLTIWTNGKNNGTLVLGRDELPDILHMFARDAGDGGCPMRTHWGGAEVGAVVTENTPGLADDMQIISEYGELLTVGRVRGRAGAKRKDGMPTELFGYGKEKP
jgi:hypothetical protein